MLINPIALRKAKIVCNFGLPECSRVKEGHLLARRTRKSYCTTPDVGVGIGIGVGGGSGVRKKLNVMGKALSGELSCPDDRSCSDQYHINITLHIQVTRNPLFPIVLN